MSFVHCSVETLHLIKVDMKKDSRNECRSVSFRLWRSVAAVVKTNISTIFFIIFFLFTCLKIVCYLKSSLEESKTHLKPPF